MKKQEQWADEVGKAHRDGSCRFDTCALCQSEHEALRDSFLDYDDEESGGCPQCHLHDGVHRPDCTEPSVPLHMQPEVAATFMGEDTGTVLRLAEVKAVYIARKEIEGKVRTRCDKAVNLTCKAYPTQVDAYHVTGGEDPNGHTVDLQAAWGVQCTCGSHMMGYALCKHLIAVYMVRGAFLADTWENGVYRPGLFSRAVQVDLENAAFRAAKKAAGGQCAMT